MPKGVPMSDREYPTGAQVSVARRLVVDRYGKAMATAVLADDDLRIGRVALDALASMSPEDRAALARWLDPEPLGEEARVRRIQAATVKRVTEWLRSEDVRAGTYLLAEAIDKRFGGPDAVK